MKTAYKYWRNVDVLKGILIILVIIGHMVPGTIDGNIIRYCIYSFHMPLFFGISGMLMKIENFEGPFLQTLKKYWNRMLFPWIVAVFVFYMMSLVLNEGSFETVTFIKAYLYPSYHLWFVLGYISYVLVFYIIWKIFNTSKRKWIWIFIIAITISSISKFEIFEMIFKDGILDLIVKVIQWDFRLYNFIFFVLGIYLRNLYEYGKLNLGEKKRVIEKVTLGLALMMILLFWWKNSFLENILFFVFNVLFVLISVDWTVYGKEIHNRLLEFIGKYSLPIYLYHVICLDFSKCFFLNEIILYYIVCIVTLIGLFVVVYLFKNIYFVNKYIFGSTSFSLYTKS